MGCDFHRYQPGDKFGKHVDDSVTVGGRASKYTLLVYLSGGEHQKRAPDREHNKALAALKGGETLFYGESCALESCSLFDS